ncbi:MAG: VPS10 domain-containing protein [Vicinamibacterales bacterium]
MPIRFAVMRHLVAIVLLGIVAFARPPADSGAQVGSAGQTGPADVVGSALDRVPMRLIGPSAPSGRVWHVVGVPSQPKTFYVCTAEGGVWRSTNNGATLIPIFDEENAAACGVVAVAASDPKQIWVGSGEPAERQSNGLGYGVYKSVDGGKTWQHLGLERTEEIAAIVIDPRDPQTVYVGATGHLWGPNPDRGVYKTTDGGRSWRKVLFVDDMTGCMDLGIDPRNPSILYATTWQRMRSGGAEMIESGPGSGIYKSIDGGEHWKKLTRGLPSESLSKIALAVAQKTPGLVYAFVMAGEPQRGGRTSEAGGIFRSNDSGESWTRVSSKIASRTYYTHINVDPSNDKRLFILDLELWRSDDGGVEWVRHNMKHVHDDLHGFWIDPHDSDHLILGGDGGLDVSMDGGATWSQTPLPIAQFYDLDVDNQTPYWVYGGMQDTASWTGPSRTYDNDGITDHDWIKLRSVGDGMAIHPDPRDPNVVFLAQNSGNLSRVDLRTWTRTELQPAPEIATRLGLHPFRWDWTAPFIISSSDPDVLYVGANYVFRCRIGAAAAYGEVAHECSVISPDLSAQQDRPYPPVGQGYHAYGALFSLAQSPVSADVLWAGADDGPIHVSRDAGAHWTRVDGNGAFHEGFVSKIEPSRTAAGTAYVSYDLHYHDDPRPYLLKTTDFGASWSNITHDLPAWGSIYVVREDPQNPRVLYVGTESGLFVSIDGGGRWVRWKSNLPYTAVRSLVVHPRDRELVVGTFGRAIWIADAAVPQQLAEALQQPAFLFDVKPTVAYNQRYTYGTSVEEVNGDRFFRAENPPYGSTITYYLKTASAPVGLVVKDSAGNSVRTLSGPGTPGLHQVQWDLETDSAQAATGTQGRGGGGRGGDRSAVTFSERQRRRRVAPGSYTVTLTANQTTFSRPAMVTAEGHDVQRVLPRK